MSLPVPFTCSPPEARTNVSYLPSLQFIQEEVLRPPLCWSSLVKRYRTGAESVALIHFSIWSRIIIFTILIKRTDISTCAEREREREMGKAITGTLIPNKYGHVRWYIGKGRDQESVESVFLEIAIHSHSHPRTTNKY